MFKNDIWPQEYLNYVLMESSKLFLSRMFKVLTSKEPLEQANWQS